MGRAIIKRGPLIILLPLMAFGCGNSGDNIAMEEICDRLVECGVVFVMPCIDQYGGMIVSKSCKQKHMDVSCQELLDPSEEFLDACWPQCEELGGVCDGDVLLDCSTRLYKFYCPESCRARGFKDGACGETLGGWISCVCET